MRLRQLLTLTMAVLPLFGAAPHSHAFTPQLSITPEQLSVTARRQRIAPAAKLECAALDTRLPQLKQNARRAKGEEKATAAQTLNTARERYEALRC